MAYTTFTAKQDMSTKNSKGSGCLTREMVVAIAACTALPTSPGMSMVPL